MLKEYFMEEEIARLKKEEDLLLKTLDLIVKVFKDKTDKSGIPYINHLLTVYSCVYTYEEKIIALLHDIVEDTKLTFKDLEELGYNENIINSLKYLTRGDNEDYKDYIERIISSNNIHTYNVKLADLKHNMDLSRLKNPTLKDRERVSIRYMPSYTKILEAVNRLQENNIKDRSR